MLLDASTVPMYRFESWPGKYHQPMSIGTINYQGPFKPSVMPINFSLMYFLVKFIYFDSDTITIIIIKSTKTILLTEIAGCPSRIHDANSEYLTCHSSARKSLLSVTINFTYLVMLRTLSMTS